MTSRTCGQEMIEMLELPKKGQIVNLAEIENICAEYKLFELWTKIKVDPPKKPFKSDGCSWWPDEWRSTTGEIVSIYNHCFIHDLHYWAGYSEKDNPQEQVARFVADCGLVMGVVKTTKRIELGTLMLKGVRVGGHERWHMHFSWGFGRR